MKQAYDCIFIASKTSIAFLILPLASMMISSAMSSGNEPAPARLATWLSTVSISSRLGAATRISRQRLLIGAINREVLLAQSMMRRLVMYFSMVRRSAACASRESVSASLMMTTVSKI
jgi:hypothetical protein